MMAIFDVRRHVPFFHLCHIFTSFLSYFQNFWKTLELWKKTLCSLFTDGVQLSQDYRAFTRRQFTFYHLPCTIYHFSFTFLTFTISKLFSSYQHARSILTSLVQKIDRKIPYKNLGKALLFSKNQVFCQLKTLHTFPFPTYQCPQKDVRDLFYFV